MTSAHRSLTSDYQGDTTLPDQSLGANRPGRTGSRRQRYISLIDKSIGYILANQDQTSSPPGRVEGAPAPTAVAAHLFLWAYEERSSRHYQDSLMVDKARLCLDYLEANPELYHPDYFAPTPMLEAITRLRRIDPQSADRYLPHALAALHEQSKGSLHDRVGHWSDWDTFFSVAAALAARLTGEKRWLELASHHAQVLHANAIDVDGLLHWTTPYEDWNASINYGGLMMSNLARYYELTGDPDAGALIDGTRDYFLHYIEPTGLMDFVPSIYPKQLTENKKDSYSFSAAAVEFLAEHAQDGRFAQVAEVLLGNLQDMLLPDGCLMLKRWRCASAGKDSALQALSTIYLRYAADWCRERPAEDLPDGYVRRHPNLNGFKARQGSFSYSVGCTESRVSLVGAANGAESILEGVFCLVKSPDDAIVGQVGPFWREYSVSAGDDVRASTAYYHPVPVNVISARLPLSPWIVLQTWIATPTALIGFATFEGPAGQAGETLIIDIHLGPAGQKIVWGNRGVRTECVVLADNAEVRQLGDVEPGSWVHFGQLGLHIMDYFGSGAGLTCSDAVAGRMLHTPPDRPTNELNTVIANDVVLSFSSEAAAADPSVRPQAGVLFSVFPSASVADTEVEESAGGVRVIASPTPTCRQIAFSSGDNWYIAMVTHEFWELGIRTLPVSFDLPEAGPWDVTVHAREGARPIRSCRIDGTRLEMEIPTLTPVQIVRIRRALS